MEEGVYTIYIYSIYSVYVELDGGADLYRRLRLVSLCLCRKEYLSCHLEVDSSLHADAGQYKVTLENKLGAASATINVKVIGT